jgi:hypothetical protein
MVTMESPFASRIAAPSPDLEKQGFFPPYFIGNIKNSLTEAFAVRCPNNFQIKNDFETVINLNCLVSAQRVVKLW